MTIIAVSQRVDAWPDRNEQRDALDQRLALLVCAAGCLPVPVPNLLEDGNLLETWLEALRPSGVLLSGGNDIGERPERDRTEGRLLDYAAAHDLPVLGLCRGMQMLATRAGGTLEPIDGHVRTRRVLHGALGGEVTCFHRFRLADCPTDFEVTARAADGTIEAIRHRRLRHEGWMWHPEREPALTPTDVARLQLLFA